MNFSSIRTLLLFADYTDKLSYFDDWKNAFESSPFFNTESINVCNNKNLGLVKKTFRDFELIILHHSTNGDTLKYIEPYRNIIKNRKAKLLSFVGNEVNLPRSPISVKINFLKDIEADFIGTQLLLETGIWLYSDCSKSRVIPTPHALNPNIFKSVMPIGIRPIDIGVRTNTYWSCLGDNERNDQINYFLNHKFEPPLNLDISTISRFNRFEWADFLNKCKGTISTEAGSYYLEKDDKTINKISNYLNEKKELVIKPDSFVERLWISFPQPFRVKLKDKIKAAIGLFGIKYYSDRYENLSFQDSYDKFFKNTPKTPFYSKAISSRHFDAIGTKTCQILLRGRYNDLLEADKHYIALEHDYSNISSVMERFKDIAYRKKLVDDTYVFTMDRHTYKHRTEEIYNYLTTN